jgi:hypothetical protein
VSLSNVFEGVVHDLAARRNIIYLKFAYFRHHYLHLLETWLVEVSSELKFMISQG